MIAVDSDVLAIYHIFTGDKRFPITRDFIENPIVSIKAISIFNLLELCGIIATAGKLKDARKIFNEYFQKSDVQILFPKITLKSKALFWATQNEELMKRIERGMRLGEAVIVWTIESNEIKWFITWNKKHFVGKTTAEVLDPAEYLQMHVEV